MFTPQRCRQKQKGLSFAISEALWVLVETASTPCAGESVFTGLKRAISISVFTENSVLCEHGDVNDR